MNRAVAQKYAQNTGRDSAIFLYQNTKCITDVERNVTTSSHFIPAFSTVMSKKSSLKEQENRLELVM